MKTFKQHLHEAKKGKRPSPHTNFPIDKLHPYLEYRKGLQIRDADYADKITKALKQKKKLPNNPVWADPRDPITIQQLFGRHGSRKKTHGIEDGHHRYWGRKRAGKKTIKVFKKDI